MADLQSSCTADSHFFLADPQLPCTADSHLSCVEKLHSSLGTDLHPTSTVDPDHWLPVVQPIMSPMTPQLLHTVGSYQPASSTYPGRPVAFVYNDTMLLIDSPSTSQTPTEMGSTTARTSQFSPITMATTLNGQYPYTDHLLQLDGCCPLVPRHTPDAHSKVLTPLNHTLWKKALLHHPDRCLCTYLLEGISRGFRLGFDYNQQLTPTVRNMQSALKNPQPVLEYLNNEVENGRVIGPKSIPPGPDQPLRGNPQAQPTQ